MGNYKLIIDVKNLNRVLDGKVEKVGFFSTIDISDIDLIKEQSIAEVKKIVDEFSLACDSNTLMVFTSLYERDDRDPTSKGMTLYKISALAYYFSLFHYKLVKFTTFFSIANEHKVPMKVLG